MVKCLCTNTVTTQGKYTTTNSPGSIGEMAQLLKTRFTIKNINSSSLGVLFRLFQHFFSLAGYRKERTGNCCKTYDQLHGVSIGKLSTAICSYKSVPWGAGQYIQRSKTDPGIFLPPEWIRESQSQFDLSPWLSVDQFIKTSLNLWE